MASVNGRPANRGGFQPGQSGNPSGRPADRDIMALARRYTPDAVRTLVEVCRTAIDHPSARVTAALGLLDRGWGKPRQELDIGGSMGQALHLHLYAVQRLEEARHLTSALEAPPIEGQAEDFADELLPRSDDTLPHEAMPLWDAAKASRAAAEGAEPPDATGDRSEPETPPAATDGSK